MITKGRLLRLITMLVGGLAAPIFYAGIANADTHVCIGGYTDPTSQAMATMKAAQDDPCDVAVQWPAAVGLPGDPTNEQGSLDVGVPAAVDAYYQAGGAPVRIEGFSLGSIAAAQAGDAIRIQNGGVVPRNLSVITEGNPYGDSGIVNDPGIAGLGFHIVGPFFGAPQDVPQMGTNRNNINDAWGDTANQVPQTQIADVATIPWNHDIPDPRSKHDTYVMQGANVPVTNEVYDIGDNPISAAAARNGTPVPPPIDAFFDVTFPVNNPANPGINSNIPTP